MDLTRNRVPTSFQPSLTQCKHSHPIDSISNQVVLQVGLGNSNALDGAIKPWDLVDHLDLRASLDKVIVGRLLQEV